MALTAAAVTSGSTGAGFIEPGVGVGALYYPHPPPQDALAGGMECLAPSPCHYEEARCIIRI